MSADERLRAAASVFDALSSEVRLKIIVLVCQSSRPLHIKAISRQLKLNYATIYRHIEALEELGIVEIYEVGRSRVLSVPKADKLDAIVDMAITFLKKKPERSTTR